MIDVDKGIVCENVPIITPNGDVVVSCLNFKVADLFFLLSSTLTDSSGPSDFTPEDFGPCRIY